MMFDITNLNLVVLVISLTYVFLLPENLKLIAEYFQNSETLGGPTSDWIGIYEECATYAIRIS